jgi:competence protein ComEA
MRSRPTSDASVADVTRRRLDALIAELAAARGEEPPRSDPGTAPAPVQPARNRALTGRHAQRPLKARRRLAGWIDDRLPGAVQGRAHLGSAQFGLVALVVAVGLVAGAWWLVRSAGSSGEAGDVAPPRPAATAGAVPGVSPSALTSAPASVPPSVSPSPAGGASPVAGDQIVVDVVGKVRRPGIAVLPIGSRVVDAVRAAGGMRPGVDPATVNLARPLSDGEQIVVGLSTVPGVPAGPVAPIAPGGGAPVGAALVNLNTADQATLETLPGVGPVTAAAILEWRAEHGGFTAVDELLEVSGIGDATLAEIAPHVTV